jgi:hypothetical protein
LSAIPPIGGPSIAQPASGVAPRARAGAAAPAPALWQVLTDDERAYFQSIAALGPVSYGPGGSTAGSPASPVGQRVDVKG